MMSLPWGTEQNSVFVDLAVFEKGAALSSLEELRAAHCELRSLCICVSKLVRITCVIKLLFSHHCSEIAFPTQRNL